MVDAVAADAIPVTYASIAGMNKVTRGLIKMTDKKPTFYIDTFKGLQAVTFLGWAKTPLHEETGLWNAVVKIKSAPPNAHVYNRGEVLHVCPRNVVIKAGFKDYQQRIKTAELPQRTEANTIESRY